MASRSDAGKPVKIKIKTVISHENDEQTFELKTFGQYYIKGQSSYLRYEEVLEDGTVYSTVKLTADEIVILRTGSVRMKMTFQKGKELAGQYKTPYGLIDMATRTKEMTHFYLEKEKKGSIRIQYDLKMQGALAGTYDLQMQFEEENK